MMKKTLATAAVLASFALAGATNAAVIYTSDFEADGGGWSASGDWERGIPVGFNGNFGSLEPTGGNSGDYVWGTVIGGNHSPSTTSVLTQTFDFTGFENVELSFAEWIDSGSNIFDTASTLVVGGEVYLSDGFSGDAWRDIFIDLSAFDNTAGVDISFVFATTSVVERTGWYLDDITLTGDVIAPAVPEPASLLLIGLGALGLAVQRRRTLR